MTSKKIVCTNLAFYDTTKYEPIGMISAISVHAISAARGFFAGISGTFGGKMEAIESKYIDIRQETLDDLKKKAKDNNADMIVGIEFDISNAEQNFIVCLATGTLLRKKGSKQVSDKK